MSKHNIAESDFRPTRDSVSLLEARRHNEGDGEEPPVATTKLKLLADTAFDAVWPPKDGVGRLRKRWNELVRARTRQEQGPAGSLARAAEGLEGLTGHGQVLDLALEGHDRDLSAVRRMLGDYGAQPPHGFFDLGGIPNPLQPQGRIVGLTIDDKNPGTVDEGQNWVHKLTTTLVTEEDGVLLGYGVEACTVSADYGSRPYTRAFRTHGPFHHEELGADEAARLAATVEQVVNHLTSNKDSQ